MHETSRLTKIAAHTCFVAVVISSSAVRVTAASPGALSRADYLSLVSRYRQSRLNWERARTQLASVRPDELKAWTKSPPLSTLDLQAAVLLHTEVAFMNLAPGAADARDLQMDAADAILSTIDDNTFRRKWRLAAGYFYQSTLSADRALHYLDEAREEFGEFGGQLLASGMVHEILGILSLEKIPQWSIATINRTDRDRRLFREHRKRGRVRLREARSRYDRALELDPELVRAHLRRGRCLQLLEEKSAAMSDFTFVALSSSATRQESGLAYLFMGQQDVADQNYVAAVAHYKSAVERLPNWQVAHIALSHSLDRLRRTTESLAALRAGLDVAAGRGRANGGIGQYHLGLSEFEILLADLRNAVQR